MQFRILCLASKTISTEAAFAGETLTCVLASKMVFTVEAAFAGETLTCVSGQQTIFTDAGRMTEGID